MFSGLRLIVVPSLALMLGLVSACTTVRSGACPNWPEAGPEVAQELEANMLPRAEAPAFWGWMARLEKLEQKLEACNNAE